MTRLCILLVVVAGCGGGNGGPRPDAGPEAPADTGVQQVFADASPGPADAAPVPDLRPREAALVVSPAAQAFGEVELGQTGAPRRFVVVNVGAEPSGPVQHVLATGDFSVTGDTCDGPLEPQKQCELSVVFGPAGASGPRAAQLTVSATPGTSVLVSLSGEAIAPRAVNLRPTMHLFPAVTLPAEPANQPDMKFTVSNAGPGPSEPLAGAVEGADRGEFALSEDSCGSSPLGPGASCTFTVRFAPATSGTKQAALVVRAGLLHLAAPLTGVAVQPAKLALAQAELSIEGVPVGMRNVVQIDVVNEGGLASGPLEVALSGDAAGEFSSMTTGCPGPLPGGATCTITIAFAPTSPGSRAVSLRVSATPGGADMAEIHASAIP
jgi:hypothetical protein